MGSGYELQLRKARRGCTLAHHVLGFYLQSKRWVHPDSIGHSDRASSSAAQASHTYPTLFTAFASERIRWTTGSLPALHHDAKRNRHELKDGSCDASRTIGRGARLILLPAPCIRRTIRMFMPALVLAAKPNNEGAPAAQPLLVPARSNPGSRARLASSSTVMWAAKTMFDKVRRNKRVTTHGHPQARLGCRGLHPQAATSPTSPLPAQGAYLVTPLTMHSHSPCARPPGYPMHHPHPPSPAHPLLPYSPHPVDLGATPGG